MKTRVCVALMGGILLSSSALADDLSARLAGLPSIAMPETEMEQYHARYVDMLSYLTSRLPQHPPEVVPTLWFNLFTGNSQFEPAQGFVGNGESWEYVVDNHLVPDGLGGNNMPLGNLQPVHNCRFSGAVSCDAGALSDLANILP